MKKLTLLIGIVFVVIIANLGYILFIARQNVAATVKAPIMSDMTIKVSVPILMYHIVHDYTPKDAGYSVAIPVANFTEQMQYLADNNYQTLTLDDYRFYIENHQTLPQKSVIITFDDGQHSIYDTVFPIIKEQNLHITVFVITNYTNDRKTYGNSYMTWEQMKDLRNSGLVSFGSHSVTHRLLATLSPDEVQKELHDSKQEIENKLGITVNNIAYPGGSFNDNVLVIATQEGYKMGITVIAGRANPDEGMLALHRYDINRKVTLNIFKSYVEAN